MEQHDARSGGITLVNVVETCAVALNELADLVGSCAPSWSNRLKNHLSRNDPKVITFACVGSHL
jgi:hypothetical protein